MTEACFTPYRGFKGVNFDPDGNGDRREDDLRDAHASLNGERLASEVDERHEHLATVV
jgi:hypothetical protein